MSSRDFWVRLLGTGVFGIAVAGLYYTYTKDVWRTITVYEGILLGSLLYNGIYYWYQRRAAARFLAKKAKWTGDTLTAVKLAKEMSDYHTNASQIAAYHDNVSAIEAEGIKRGYIKVES